MRHVPGVQLASYVISRLETIFGKLQLAQSVVSDWPDPEKVDRRKLQFCPIMIFSRFLDR